MKLNKQLKTLYNVTDEDFVQWCNFTERNPEKKKSLKDFIKRLLENKFRRDKLTNRLVERNEENE